MKRHAIVFHGKAGKLDRHCLAFTPKKLWLPRDTYWSLLCPAFWHQASDMRAFPVDVNYKQTLSKTNDSRAFPDDFAATFNCNQKKKGIQIHQLQLTKFVLLNPLKLEVEKKISLSSIELRRDRMLIKGAVTTLNVVKKE